MGLKCLKFWRRKFWESPLPWHREIFLCFTFLLFTNPKRFVCLAWVSKNFWILWTPFKRNHLLIVAQPQILKILPFLYISLFWKFIICSYPVIKIFEFWRTRLRETPYLGNPSFCLVLRSFNFHLFREFKPSTAWTVQKFKILKRPFEENPPGFHVQYQAVSSSLWYLFYHRSKFDHSEFPV